MQMHLQGTLMVKDLYEQWDNDRMSILRKNERQTHLPTAQPSKHVEEKEKEAMDYMGLFLYVRHGTVLSCLLIT